MTQPSTNAPLQSVHAFFETWLPARFEEFSRSSAANSVSLNTHCSVYVEVDGGSWLVSLADKALQVVPNAADAQTATFRLHVAERIFQHFVLPEVAKVSAMPSSLPSDLPALKLLKLDDEALSLVQNVPGCLRLLVDDAGTPLCVTFGPGSQSAEPPACTLKCTLEDLEALKAGNAQPMELFFSGRIQLEGDAQVAMALAGLFL